MENEIQIAAYYQWEAAGRPDGRDLEFWLEAERIVNDQPRIVFNDKNVTKRRGKKPIASKTDNLSPIVAG